MTTAHPALRPWEAHLAALSPAAQGSMSAWLPRLSALMGTARRRAGPEHGEPDGYDGLAQRGPLDRLSTEDLALRELEELEFLRRYAAGELRYHHLARRVPAAARRSLVLFDTGPEQLGAARLVHLALLVVLARRTQQDGGVLSWSALPTGGQVHTLALPDDLVKLAGARSWSVGPWSVEGWQARIAAIDDLFVVGGEAAVELAAGLRGEAIRVSEEGEALIVQRGTRRVTLPLADRGLAAQALTAPLGGKAPSHARKVGRFDATPRTLRFSPSGGHLIVELSSGDVGAIRCGPRRARKKFRPFTCWLGPNDRALAATVHKNRLVVVTRVEGELRIHAGGSPDQRITPRGPLPEPPTDGLRCVLVEGSKSGPVHHFLDVAGRLVRLDSDGAQQAPLPPVLDFARGPAGQRVLLASGRERWVDFQQHPPPPRAIGALLPEATEGLLGPLVDGVAGHLSPASTLAFRLADGWWVQRAGLWQQDRLPPVRVGEVGPDDRVVGVICAPTLGVHEALVLLVGGRRVVARTPTGQVTLLTLPVPVVNAVVSPATLQVAVARADGVIAVIDLANGETNLELAPGSP